MRRLVLLLLIAFAPLPAWAISDVVSTVHNLSATGPGLIKSLTVTEVCVFCHTPHNASPQSPLWNHQLTAQWYIEYGSTTLKSSPGQPTGKSRYCLACHDGTVALGAIGNAPSSQTVDLQDVFLTGRAKVGTDLSDDHPISFSYDGALVGQNHKLVNPVLIDLPLEQSALQCTTCHDPHERDLLPFMRKTTLNGSLCTTCHDQSGATQTWSSSSHATSTKTPTGANPWAERKAAWRGSTVAENSCFGCHRPHTAATPQRLIKDAEEQVCYLCHNGTVAAKNIQAEFAKPSVHPVASYSGIHDPIEDLLSAPKHVECADCHNPHGSDAIPAAAPAVPGPRKGARGITSGAAPIAEVQFAFEVCFACHADNNARSSPWVPRQINEFNTRLEFDPGNPSYHPVGAPGKNPNVPSLLTPYTTASFMRCTSCHANNSGPEAGGTGPSGPHGSLFSPLLIKNYTTADNTSESSTAYALCYTCHNRTSILNDQSFKEHRKHIDGERAPCSACHDPHGISSTQGNPTNNSHLINFDPTIVTPSGSNLRFEDQGTFRGRCYLKCHGKNHNPLSY